MFYSDTIEETRLMFFTSWEKYRDKKPLSPLEDQIVQAILDHPEYHKIFNQKDKTLQQSYLPELGQTNPFMHMGLHLAIREQINTNRPLGIQKIYQELSKYSNSLEAEHLMMDQLAECLWNCQKNNSPPDEELYLQQLRLLLEG